MFYLIMLLAVYLLGFVFSAILISCLLGFPDLCTEGFRNFGVTNVLCLGSKFGAVFILVGDIVKGVLLVFVAWWILDEFVFFILVVFGAFLGYLFLVYFRFEGGKGVAIVFGVLVVIDW